MRAERYRVWVDLLASLVPAEREAGLLRVLLWDDGAARAQWLKWRSVVENPKTWFERDYLGRKGLLAFLAHRVSASGIDVGEDFATYVRVAQVREELRSRIFLETLGSVLVEMGRMGVEPILINGAAYALTVYAEPLVRHNHGIDLVTTAEELDAARRAVSAAGFRTAGTAALPGGSLETFRHGSGLELTLRPKLFLAPHVAADRGAVRSRCREIAFGDVRVHVLSPTDRICHTLGESASGPTRRNLRWACDAYLLLGHREPLDFDLLVATADDLGIALPCAVLLEFFRAKLQSPVPPDVIQALQSRGAPRDAGRRALLLSTALRTSTSVDEFVKRASRGPLFLRAARFAFFPTAEHIAYQQRPAAPGRLLRLYAARFVRLLKRPFKGLRRLRIVTS